MGNSRLAGNGSGRTRLGFLAAAILWGSAAAVGGCGGTEGVRPNRPPTVEITSGPVEGDTVSYSLEIGWEGTDPDGVIDRYEYAVDPPAAFTEEEIASGGEGIQSEVIPGSGSGPDVTRITKLVDGGPVSFDWVHTAAVSHRFLFRTTDAESVEVGGSYGPTGRFTGMHAVYVRAVDDDQAVSVPDHVAFTAETLAPEATILRPDISEILQTGPHVSVDWSGTDPDGPAPVGYLYKLVRLDTLGIVIPEIYPDFLYRFGGAWAYRSADTSGIVLNPETLRSYLFGVRAVDEAGAEEPFLDFGRNAFMFTAMANGGFPTVTLDCLSGDYVFRGYTSQVEVTVPADRELECEVTCSAEEYGESCADMRWGLDVADLDTDEGWSPWSTDFTLGPVRLSRSGIHVLYVEVRDTAGNSTLATLILNAIEFTFDREVLWVDDSFDDTYPRDSEQDAFWRRMFDGYGKLGTGDVSEFHSHLDNDRGAIHPVELKLSDLARYKLLVWDNRGSGFDGDSGLFRVTRNHVLDIYLAAGGKLWLDGRMNLAATVPDASGLRGDLMYPKAFEPGDFAWDYLKLHTTKVDDDKGQYIRNNLYTVRPFPGMPETYPQMNVDPDKQSAGLRGLGITHTDAVFDPMLDESEPGFRGTVDSLYAYGATGNEIQEKASRYQNRLVAVRWHDPDPSREQGRIQWFGFALYYFNDVEAQETVNRSLDWFREETPPSVP